VFEISLRKAVLPPVVTVARERPGAGGLTDVERGAADRRLSRAHRVAPARGGAVAREAFVDIPAEGRLAVERPAPWQAVRPQVDRLVHRRAAAVVLHVIVDRNMVAGPRRRDAADLLAVGDHRQAFHGLRRDRGGAGEERGEKGGEGQRDHARSELR
jgi:hypothetical protein